MVRTGDKGLSWLEPVACAAVALAYVVPLLFTRYFPGLDLPWHAAITEVIHRHDAGAVHRDFLGFFAVEHSFSSYLTLYIAVDLLAFVFGDVVVAMQILIAGYVAAFVFGARRLIRAFDGHGSLAVLAAPAAFSVTMEYGFLAYALTYPMTLYLWALVQEVFAGKWSRWRFAGIALLSTLIAITHPFAAVIAIAGAGVIIAMQFRREPQAAIGAIACALAGIVPAVIAVLSVAGSGKAEQPHIMRNYSLWQKLWSQEFTSVPESLASAPFRLFGFLSPAACFLLVGGALVAAVLARQLGGLAKTPVHARFALWLLFGGLALAYLITPFTFQWPKRWYAVQPRLLPLLWVVGLTLLRTNKRVRRPDLVGLPTLAITSLAWALLVLTTWWPFASEASDFRAVAKQSASNVRTLALIEHEPTRERYPASPWRHFGAYILVDHGGFVSHLPMSRPFAGNAGALVPVKRAIDSPRLPKQPRQGFPRSFDWQAHARGWDQFLIRDLDPDAPWDYFRRNAKHVKLVARRGRWRLYRRRQPARRSDQ